MLKNTNVQEISKAILVLRELNADEKMRYLAEMREKALHDEANAINSAEKRGRIEGIEEGIEEGRKEGKAEGISEGKAVREAEIVENLRKIGMSEEQIQNVLNNKK